MRALPDGKGFICKSCLSSTENKITNLHKDKSPKIDIEKEFFDRRRFVCRACKYKFSKPAGTSVKACPYCGKSNLEEKFD